MGDLLKKILVGGAIALSAAIPAFGQAKIFERYVLQRSPAISLLNNSFHVALPKDQNKLNSLGELIYRLEKDGFSASRMIFLCMDERFTVHKNLDRFFRYNPESECPDYKTYRKEIGLDQKIAEGPKWFVDNHQELFNAEDAHGTESTSVAAVIGVESDFGDNLGKYRAFNAGTSLYSTSKKEFAYKQFKALLGFSEKYDLDVYEVYVSYAMCGGPGAFLMTNLEKRFIGKNDGSKPDFSSMTDWIHSVAYYLQQEGWNRKHNYAVPEKGSANWNALFAYNHSVYYVLAVNELTQAIRNDPSVKALIEHHQEFKRLGKLFNLIQ